MLVTNSIWKGVPDIYIIRTKTKTCVVTNYERKSVKEKDGKGDPRWLRPPFSFSDKVSPNDKCIKGVVLFAVGVVSSKYGLRSLLHMQ